MVAAAALAVLVAVTGCAGGGGSGGGPPPPATTGPPVRLIIFGDSVTHGSAGDFTWRYRLAKHLTLSAPGRVDFVGDRDDLWDNVADVGGSQAYADPYFDRDHHARWGDALRVEVPTIEGVLRKNPADVVLVALGANDLAYWTSSPATLALMRQLVDNARRANPNVTFVIGHVLTRWDPYTNSPALAAASEFNQLLDAQAPGWSTPTSKVVIARSDQDWNPRQDTWDGSHPDPDGEMLIARGFANALAGLGIGGQFGEVYSGLAWPGTGQTPTATPAGGTRYTLTWPATPGAADYLIERRVLSPQGESSYSRLPSSVRALTWTTDDLPLGAVVAYRVVPVKFWMVGQPGPPVTFTVTFD
ncbi:MULTISPECIES: GDSL-type esterase/lipase family protein [Pseudofrankia]|uniref:GDSL-type esterase/lipase family protein n=1 Tax=Pseudofrankia TaxID=2994363 RepID=UPI000234BE73|nr:MULTISPECIES: GDSL-type esterase/lipase family protein [Pseudofrankia]OHV33578.1 GDSL family lipase [Pseudofrankia sp. EUN1h]